MPLLVSMVAVYRFSGSMHMGGGPSKLRRWGLDPSTAGHFGRHCCHVSLIVTDSMVIISVGLPLSGSLAVSTLPFFSIDSRTFIPRLT